MKRLSRVDRLVIDKQLRELAEDVAKARAAIAPLMKDVPGEDYVTRLVRDAEGIGRTSASLSFIENNVAALRERLALPEKERL